MNARTKSGLLTTGEVAKLCDFSPSAVLQWIRSGKLQAYSSPGGQHRVETAELCRFLKAHGMRIPEGMEGRERHRVLIVEDEEAVRNLLVTVLRQALPDCVVEGADNGLSACMQIPVFQPDLLVLDLIMPELDAAELCRLVKVSEQYADMRILLVTGHPEDERVAEALDAGADACMAKPIDLAAFVAQVEELLGAQPRPDKTALAAAELRPQAPMEPQGAGERDDRR